MGDCQGAIDIFKRLGRRTSYFRQDEYDRAMVAASRGRTAEALKLFNHAFSMAPDRSQALCAMGRDALGSGQIEEALRYFRHALRLKPKYADIHNMMGVCYSQMGKRSRALEHLHKAVSLAPNFTRAWINLAYVYEQEGEIEAARAAYRRVLKMDPKNQIAKRAVAKLNTHGGRR